MTSIIDASGAVLGRLSTNTAKRLLKGEEIDNKKHHMIVDVKAVSWHMYKVEKKEEWNAFVILDV